MLQRNISRETVISVLKVCEVIQTYEEDKPYPSVLMLGFQAKRPIHVVATFNEMDLTVYVITAYEPDRNLFEDDFKTRKK